MVQLDKVLLLAADRSRIQPQELYGRTRIPRMPGIDQPIFPKISYSNDSVLKVPKNEFASAVFRRRVEMIFSTTVLRRIKEQTKPCGACSFRLRCCKYEIFQGLLCFLRRLLFQQSIKLSSSKHRCIPVHSRCIFESMHRRSADPRRIG